MWRHDSVYVFVPGINVRLCLLFPYVRGVLVCLEYNLVIDN